MKESQAVKADPHLVALLQRMSDADVTKQAMEWFARLRTLNPAPTYVGVATPSVGNKKP